MISPQENLVQKSISPEKNQLKNRPVTILVVEDEADHAELIQRAFQAQAGHMMLILAASLAEAREHLARSAPDLAIVDLVLPDGKGTDLLDEDLGQPGFPVIVLTGHGDEQVAVDALKAGAFDYLSKSDAIFLGMPHIAELALRKWREVIERQQASEALRISEERFRGAF